MSLPALGNKCETTLGADITGSPATFSLAGPLDVAWPASGRGRFNIFDTEVIEGDISGTTVTIVNRAVEKIGNFSTAQNHTKGDRVLLIASWGAIQQLAPTKIDEIGPLGSAQASFAFPSAGGNLPSNFRHLAIEIVARGTNASQSIGGTLQFNGDGGANYGEQRLTANGATVVGQESGAVAKTSIENWQITAGSEPAGWPGWVRIFVPLYAATTFRKLVDIRTGFQIGTAFPQAAMGDVNAHVGFWNSTAAITSLTLALTAGNFDVGSYAELWGYP